MRNIILACIVTMMSICIVSSAKLEDVHLNELNAKVRNIVENILDERKCKTGLDESGLRLMKEVEDLRNNVTSMESQLANQNRIVVELQEHIQKLQAKPVLNTEKKTLIKSASMVIDKFAKPGSDYSTNSRSLSVQNFGRGRRVRRAVVGNVAFSAYLTVTNSHTANNQPIRFDKVLLNDGHAYNSYTGAFTAPLSGVYLFTFSFDSRKLTFVRLVIDGVNQVDAVANAHTNAESRHSQSMGGNTAIIHVAHGQSVRVEPYEISDGETASSNTFRLCTFSGVLLY